MISLVCVVCPVTGASMRWVCLCPGELMSTCTRVLRCDRCFSERGIFLAYWSPVDGRRYNLHRACAKVWNAIGVTVRRAKKARGNRGHPV